MVASGCRRTGQKRARGDTRALKGRLLQRVNVWEIVFKRALGKLAVPRRFSRVLEEQPFERLAMTVDHAFKVGELPMHHRDPFDRLLIAQCLVEGLTLVTHDGDIAKYDVPIILT